MGRNQRSFQPLYVFLSYSSTDKRFANELKNSLAVFGLKVFLAHQDISPSLDWQQTIVESIHLCDVFIPILTKNFRTSFWTDQECGIAFTLNKFILPICVHTNPYGFLGRFQALRAKKGSVSYLAERILSSLAEQKSLRNKLRETIISALKSHLEPLDATALIDVLIRLSPFSQRQVDLILTKVITNERILNSDLPRYVGRFILIPNQTRVSNKVLGRFQAATNWHFDD